MVTLDLHEVISRFSELCEEVTENGDILLVTRHGKLFVQIVPCPEGSEVRSVLDTVDDCMVRFGPLTDDFDLPPRELTVNRGDIIIERVNEIRRVVNVLKRYSAKRHSAMKNQSSDVQLPIYLFLA